MRITRCECRRTPFATLFPLARANAWDFDTLVQETGCGAQCGLCRPYLRRMLATGETVFYEILTEDTAAPVPHGLESGRTGDHL